jgi:hypothetical protein
MATVKPTKPGVIKLKAFSDNLEAGVKEIIVK